jgi:hypothetical protein
MLSTMILTISMMATLDQHQANAQTVRSIQNQIYAQSESSICINGDCTNSNCIDNSRCDTSITCINGNCHTLVTN